MWRMINLPRDEPLPPPVVRRLARHILRTGGVQYSDHALARMASQDLRIEDCEHAIRAGQAMPAEWEHGSWRYQLRTRTVTIVVAFSSIAELRVVTAWRNQP